METPTVLSGLVVAERGGRLATAVASTLLAELGATVLRLEDDAGRPRSDPLAWHSHPLALEGKQRYVAEGDKNAAWQTLCAQADVVLVSDAACASYGTTEQLIAVLTAFGAAEPDAAACELAVQARSGAMATTGPTDGAPCAVRAPLLEVLAGVNAATSVLAALRAGTQGVLDLALVDSAFALAGTFHPQALANPSQCFRNGSRHTLCAPWNSYRAMDGWVTICIATDDQWQRFAKLLDLAHVTSNSGLVTSPQRVAATADIDRAITQWTQTLSVAEVVRLLRQVDLPVSAVCEAGPQSATSVRSVTTPDSIEVTVPGPVAWLSRTPLQLAGRVTAPQTISEHHPQARRRPWRTGADGAPLRGIRVIDLGPFTAGPLTARYLSDLGADVIKVEPPGGERSRDWHPRVAHSSHYFANYNCGKRSVELDLGTATGASALRELISGADVLVQNLKPGALRKLGVDLDAIAVAHPSLIVCNISGFGRSAPPVAALDTVVQAGTGLMSLVDGPTHAGPLKTGFSYADLTAAHVSACMILAALVERDVSARGQTIDVAMHDALVWLAQLGWPDIAAPAFTVAGSGNGWVLQIPGEAAVPVLDVAPAVLSDTAQRRKTLRPVPAGTEGRWHVLASPHRWRCAASDTGEFIAAVGADNSALLHSESGFLRKRSERLP